MKNLKAEQLKFSIVQFTFWCSWCSFTSFAALFFRQQGLSESQIGFAISLSTLSGILGQFIWGLACDKFCTIKKNFIAANIIIWAAVLSFLLIKSASLIFVMMSVLGFAQVPQPSIIDSWILKKLPGKEEEYGRIRLWASIGFAFSALVFGWAIRNWGFNIMFIASSFFIFVTLLTAFSISDINEGKNHRKGLKNSIKILLTSRAYLFLIITCFFVGLAFRTIRLLLPLIVESVGGTPWDLGLAYFFGVITEVPMFVLSKKLAKKVKPNFLLFSVIMFMAEFLILIIATSPFLVMIAMLAQGLAFGNYLPSLRLFVNNNSPENLGTFAQTFADAALSSLTAVIGSAVGGFIMEKCGVKAVLIIGMALLAIALIIFTTDIFLKNKISKYPV